MTTLNIAVLPGDGIGGEVMDVVLPVFDRLGMKVRTQFGDIGWEFWRMEGNAVPERTWQLIEEADTVLLGTITSKPNQEAFEELAPHLRASAGAYLSPVIQLRQRLGLFANVRPVFGMREHSCQVNGNMNFVVIRENTEGLYSGFDFHPLPEELYRFIQANKSPRSHWNLDSSEDGAVAIRLMTRSGMNRLLEFAFQWAEQNGYSKVTWVDKPNVMRQSGQFALDIVREVAGTTRILLWMFRMSMRQRCGW